jgi:hypothetical protein
MFGTPQSLMRSCLAALRRSFNLPPYRSILSSRSPHSLRHKLRRFDTSFRFAGIELVHSRKMCERTEPEVWCSDRDRNTILLAKTYAARAFAFQRVMVRLMSFGSVLFQSCYSFLIIRNQSGQLCSMFLGKRESLETLHNYSRSGAKQNWCSGFVRR